MINICKNCGKETKNKKFCSKECQFNYKFKHQRRKSSKLEKFIFKKLKEKYSFKIIHNDRNTLKENLELDIYIPEIKVAIEINGLQHYQFVKYFHHSKKNFEKQKELDQRKQELCKEQNIYLITIPNLETFNEEKSENIFNDLILIIDQFI